jgi:hypothetical protein
MPNTQIPRWIMIYGTIQVLLVIGFGAMFFMNADITAYSDPSWFVGVRNVAILVILLLGIWRKDVTILFIGFLARFIIDTGDATNSLLSGELMNLVVFIPFLIIPLGYGSWVLWQLKTKQATQT